MLRRKPSPTVEVYATIDHAEFGEVDCVVVANVAPGDPGKLTGPPEHCYPGSDPEVDILEIVVESAQHKGKQIDVDSISEKERDLIEVDAVEKFDGWDPY